MPPLAIDDLGKAYAYFLRQLHRSVIECIHELCIEVCTEAKERSLFELADEYIKTYNVPLEFRDDTVTFKLANISVQKDRRFAYHERLLAGFDSFVDFNEELARRQRKTIPTKYANPESESGRGHFLNFHQIETHNKRLEELQQQNEQLNTYVSETEAKNAEALKCIEELQAQLAAVGVGNANEESKQSADVEASEDENRRPQERVDSVEGSSKDQSSPVDQNAKSETVSKSPPQTLQDMLDLYPHED